MAKLTISSVLGQATVQDLGRTGFAHFGITQSGALDAWSMKCANALVSNPPGSAVLELSPGGIRFSVNCRISAAVTGARCSVHINDKTVPQYQTLTLNPQDVIEIKPSRVGARVYLAFAGGIDSTPLFNSQSTCLREGLGVSLIKGTRLTFCSPWVVVNKRLRTDQIPSFSPRLRLGLVMGYQQYLLNWQQRHRFFSSEYKVSPLNDRMGYRLHTDTPTVAPLDGIRSEGVALGALQIASDGQPIIMLNDHQTLGGHMKLGAVCSVDLERLAQAIVGTCVQFYPLSLEQAQRRTRYNAKKTPIMVDDQ